MNRTLIAALRSVVAAKPAEDIDHKFELAVSDWINDDQDSLEEFASRHPEYLDQVDKGMEYQPLYRAVLLNTNLFLRLVGSGLTEYRIYPSAFESWTTDQTVASGWNKYVGSKWDVCSVVFKKSIPEKDRVVCLPCMDSDHKWARDEKEVVTKVQKKTAKDIDIISIRLPYRFKGEVPEFSEPGKQGQDSSWQEVSLKDAVYWAENYEALAKEAKDKGMIFSWKPKGVK